MATTHHTPEMLARTHHTTEANRGAGQNYNFYILYMLLTEKVIFVSMATTHHTTEILDKTTTIFSVSFCDR